MTRINAGINPVRLIDQHLIAEYRELPRVLSIAKKRKHFNDIPKQFNLGKGHVLFFIDKLVYIEERYQQIVKEMERRKFVVNFGSPLGLIQNHNLYNDYAPSALDKIIIRDRLSERIMEMTQPPRYFGKPIPKNSAVQLLRRNVIQTSWLNSGELAGLNFSQQFKRNR